MPIKFLKEILQTISMRQMSEASISCWYIYLLSAVFPASLAKQQSHVAKSYNFINFM